MALTCLIGPFTTLDLFNDVLVGATTKRQIVALEESHVFGPSLVNTVRAGFDRSFVNNDEPVKAVNPLAGDHSIAAVPGQYVAGSTIPGIGLFQGGLGGLAIFFYRWNAYQAYDDAITAVSAELIYDSMPPAPRYDDSWPDGA